MNVTMEDLGYVAEADLFKIAFCEHAQNCKRHRKPQTMMGLTQVGPYVMYRGDLRSHSVVVVEYTDEGPYAWRYTAKGKGTDSAHLTAALEQAEKEAFDYV